MIARWFRAIASGVAALSDIVLLLRTDVFMHSAYALRYLGSRRHVWLSLLHYAFKGHELGYRANPFVDPDLRDPSGNRISAAQYLRRRDLRWFPPSHDFDPRWYSARHMAGTDRSHPFLHFWNTGFDAGASPSPRFDMDFFTNAVAAQRPDKKEVAFERSVDTSMDFPRNAEDLAKRQNRFIDGLAFDVLADKPSERKHLVFIQAAAEYDVPFVKQPRGFDILLNCYDKRPDHLSEAEIVVFQTGTKATAIRMLLRNAPDLLLRYDAVFFLDDDIEISSSDIDTAFALFTEYGLDLAQPSLTEDSACAFDVLKQPIAGQQVRGLTAVEIMMPMISRRALATCGDAFEAAISGWGVDLLLSVKVRKCFGDTIALLPQVVAAHRRPIDLDGGAFYRFLRRHGLDPSVELGSVSYKFGLSVDDWIAFAPLQERLD